MNYRVKFWSPMNIPMNPWTAYNSDPVSASGPDIKRIELYCV